MPGGRPRIYSPAILIKTRRYVNAKYPNAQEVIPTVDGLAVYLGVARSMIYEWAKHEDKKEFSDTVEKLRAIQGKTLQNGGISGNFNPTITKLLLGVNHGMREKVDITTNEKDLPAASTNILSKVYGTSPDAK